MKSNGGYCISFPVVFVYGMGAVCHIKILTQIYVLVSEIQILKVTKFTSVKHKCTHSTTNINIKLVL